MPRTLSRRRRRPLSAALLPACLVAIGAASAQGDPGTITVTASRTGESEASATATLRAADIARYQAPTLRDALGDVAGVRAFSTGGVGGGSFVSIRGGEPNFTLVLLDGVRVTDTTNSKGGGFDFGLVDPALIERVEIDRGASSAIHGSDALSGVINIRLRAPADGETHAGARVETGTRGEVGGSLSLSTGWHGGGLLLAGGGFDSDGMDRGSSLRRGQGLVRADQTIGAYHAILLGTYARDRHSIFPEDSGGPELAVNRAREIGHGDLWTAAASLRHAPEGSVRPELSLSYSDQRTDAATPAIFPGVLSGVPAITARNRLGRFEAIGDVVLAAGPLVATLGAAYLDEDGRSRGTIVYGFPLPANFTLDRRTASGFAEATLTPLRRLTLNGAIRYDAVADGPHRWTGRAGLAYRLAEHGPALFARIGQGFKLPSFYALGSPLVGNPALRPERSRNAEAGIEWRAADGRELRLAWFDNRFTDLVDFDPRLFRLVNRDRVRARGVEASTAWPIVREVALTGALTYLDLDSPEPLRGRPRWQGNMGVVWHASPALGLSGRLRFNSSFYDSSVPTGLIVTGGHTEADVNLGYRFSRSLHLDLALRNIGDARAWQSVGYPQTGRELRATLAATL